MELSDLMQPEFMLMDMNSTTKTEALTELAQILRSSGRIADLDKYLAAVLAREEEGTTGFGMGIAIPHGKTDAVIAPSLAFGRSATGVSFDSMDGNPVYLFFLIAVPETAHDDHLRILAKLSRKLMHEDVRQKLLTAVTKEEIVKALED